MKFNPPHKVRAILYLVTSLGTPIVGYLFAKDLVGEIEVTLWAAEVAVVNTMAALNVAPSNSEV